MNQSATAHDTRATAPSVFDVRAHGAAGDGRTLDTAAINRAIEAAYAAGGGTVSLPAGTYLSFSIHLRSRVTLHLGLGAVLLAAEPAAGFGAYDPAEPNEWDAYQDFGHSHWHNSLIWGENLEDIAILGPGRIHGAGLTRSGPGPRRAKLDGDMPVSMRGITNLKQLQADGEPGTETSFMDGKGNKAIALKNCRHVVLRDFSVLLGGHFALLASGVDDLTIDHVHVDTNRDGFDFDSCRRVRVSNCRVNAPNDDAIVLKSSYALGAVRSTENVFITHCEVSGFDEGTMLDGTFGRTQELAPDLDGVTGRIKIGTETNGSFRNITITNCVFVRSRGLALEMVDGGVIEDVTASHLTMREIVTAPLFVRLGNRGRGPDNPPTGIVRRVKISDVVVTDADPRYASQVVGLPGHPVEEVTLSNIKIEYRGGGTAADAAIEPPENEKSYPEPSMFGTLPVYGLFARHVRGLNVSGMAVSYALSEQRPPVRLDDVAGVGFDRFQGQRASGVPCFVLRQVTHFSVKNSAGVSDTTREKSERETI
jgi:polygalacturonase